MKESVQISPWQRKSVRRWIAIVAVLLALRAFLPWATARGIEYGIGRGMGLQAEIGDVDFAFLRGGVELEDVILASTPPGQEPIERSQALFAARRAAVWLSWWELALGRVHVRKVELREPALRFVQDEAGRIRIPVEVPAETEPAPSEPAQDDAGWPIWIDALKIRDARAVVNRADDAVPLEFALGGLTLDGLRFEQGALSVEALDVDGPHFRVRRDLEFAGIAFAGESGPPEIEAASPTPPEEVGEAIPLRVDKLEIRQADFLVLADDQVLESQWRIVAHAFDSASGDSFPLEVFGEVGEGSLQLVGAFSPRTLDYEGKLTWNALPVPIVALTAHPEIGAWVRSCRASGEIDVSVRLLDDPAQEAGPRIRFSGRAAVDDLSLMGPDERIGIAWESLAIEIAEFRVPIPVEGRPAEAVGIDLTSVRLTKPALRYALPATGLDDLLASFSEPGSEAPAPELESAPQVPDPQIRLGEVAIQGGSVEFADESMTPPFRTAVRDISVKARDLVPSTPRATGIDVKAELPGPAPLALRGDVGAGTRELALLVDHLDLVAFSAYAQSAAGYSVGGGTFSLDSTIRSGDSDFDLENDLVLADLDLSSSAEGGTSFVDSLGMPLDLALALLRDYEGKIRLSVPLKFGKSGVDTGVGTIAANAMRQALVGAISSPLQLVGAAIPGGGAAPPTSLEPIRFEERKDELLEGEEARFRGLAALLKARPGLGFEIEGGIGAVEREQVKEKKRAALALSRAEVVCTRLVEEYGVDQARCLVSHEVGEADSGARIRFIAHGPS